MLNVIHADSNGEGRRIPGYRERLLRQHLPQVRFIARSVASRYRPQAETDDLVSAGFVGLLDALERYDETKGVQFKTYADFRIRGAILDRLRSLDVVPKWLRQKKREIEMAYLRVEHRLGRSARQEEIAAELGIGFDEFQSLLCRLRARNLTLADEQGDAEEAWIDGQIASQRPDPFDDCYRREIRRILEAEMGKLPQRERMILIFRYQEDLTMKEIGKRLNVHHSRISQLHKKALRSLRSLGPIIGHGLSLSA